MTDSTTAREERGNVNFLMAEFPAATPPFSGDQAAELMRLHDVGLIRVLDLLVILKDSDGRVRGCEATGLDGSDLRRLEAGLPRMLAADDVWRLAEALEPGTTAGVVVWENVWVAPLVAAVRCAGGEPVATGCIASSAVVEEPADQTMGETETGSPGGRGTWEPLSPARHHPGVLGEVAREEVVSRRQTQVADNNTLPEFSCVTEDADGHRRP